jgi:hypothetical protein
MFHAEFCAIVEAPTVPLVKPTIAETAIIVPQCGSFNMLSPARNLVLKILGHAI